MHRDHARVDRVWYMELIYVSSEIFGKPCSGHSTIRSPRPFALLSRSTQADQGHLSARGREFPRGGNSTLVLHSQAAVAISQTHCFSVDLILCLPWVAGAPARNRNKRRRSVVCRVVSRVGSLLCFLVPRLLCLTFFTYKR